MTPQLSPPEQVAIVLGLVSVYAGRQLHDNTDSRRLGFAEVGISSLALASVIVELEDRLGREFDFEAFAGVETVADLLRAVGLPSADGASQ
ncbi:hypothetical protein LBMAG42_24660 [Deltaproteobacteria bacterium]|nr:hypothetical protein LBMAG42_24660 [Deltaproteobacteria bacterium]